MAKFDVVHGVQLFSENTGTINNLWGIYVVATFAAAGFGASSESISIGTAIVVTVGFWAFALGHLRLLVQALNLNRRLAADIMGVLREGHADDAGPFKPSIQYLARTANPPWISIAIHLLIDGCATAAMWSGTALLAE